MQMHESATRVSICFSHDSCAKLSDSQGISPKKLSCDMAGHFAKLQGDGACLRKRARGRRLAISTMIQGICTGGCGIGIDSHGRWWLPHIQPLPLSERHQQGGPPRQSRFSGILSESLRIHSVSPNLAILERHPGLWQSPDPRRRLSVRTLAFSIDLISHININPLLGFLVPHPAFFDLRPPSAQLPSSSQNARIQEGPSRPLGGAACIQLGG